MRLIYTLTLLLFSSSVFAEFVFVDSSISDLLDYGFVIKQIDTLSGFKHVYHLIKGTDVAICYHISGETICGIDTQDKSIIEHFNYLEQLSIEDVERDKELLAEEMDD